MTLAIGADVNCYYYAEWRPLGFPVVGVCARGVHLRSTAHPMLTLLVQADGELVALRQRLGVQSVLVHTLVEETVLSLGVVIHKNRLGNSEKIARPV
jgi:hypothetical protein